MEALWRNSKWNEFIFDVRKSIRKGYSLTWEDIRRFVSSKFDAELIAEADTKYSYTNNGELILPIKFQSEESKIEFILKYL